jgi:hypothetical protein
MCLKKEEEIEDGREVNQVVENVASGERQNILSWGGGGGGIFLPE